jgi:hypothetical protein
MQTEIGRRPLALKPEFPAVAQRWESWWRFEARRPLVVCPTPKRADIVWGKAFDLLDRPQEWLKVRRLQVENTHYPGESLPFVRADIGPVATAAFLGAPTHTSESEQTSWQEATIADWDNPPTLELDPGNVWLRRVLGATEAAARDAAGRYLVCFPDLTGAVDVLSNMRGPDRLCMDLFDRREAVKAAAERALEGWDRVFAALHDISLTQGAGVIQWLGCWSNAPHTVPTCDFNALIGGADFEEVCLPTLREQARRAGRCVFHLDGPAAARHAERLARTPEISAIQFTPGAGTPSAVAKAEMLRAVQKERKPVLVFVPREEVAAVCDLLDPRGLAIWPTGVTTPREADEVVETVARRFP